MVLTLSTVAYTKAILHCVKYPHCPIKGLLISDGTGNGSVITDVIPITHDIPTFSGIFESALLFIEKYCSTNGLYIAGLYFANQLLNDQKLDACVIKIVEKLQAKNPNAYIIQMDNTKFSLESSIKCVKAHVYEAESKTWKEKDQSLEDTLLTLKVASHSIENQLYREISDYENFLENPKLHDLLNIKLNNTIESLY
uniref:MPN domain-containing protein n=1 Tax=Parastrongyloides trichosuri TaxID=131310 RepID=A0A0N5A560_PARTI